MRQSMRIKKSESEPCPDLEKRESDFSAASFSLRSVPTFPLPLACVGLDPILAAILDPFLPPPRPPCPPPFPPPLTPAPLVRLLLLSPSSSSSLPAA